MAHFTTYSDGTPITRSSGGNAAGAPMPTVLVGEYDASKRALAAADTADVITIPAGTFVNKVFYEVLTGDATQTLNVGDGADADGFVAAADVATAGNNGMGAGALATGKYYGASGGKILIEVPATKALDTLRVRVVAHVVLTGLSPA